MGEKVVVEPPTISVEYPVSGAYLSNTVTFKGVAKAYIEVRKVEVYVFEDENNGQREIPWTDRGIVLSGGAKTRTWTYKLNTKNFNSGNDGVIKMRFRVHDSVTIVETFDLIYIIKNLPADIRMTSPDGMKIIDALASSKINHGGEIQGQIIDRRGLRPGYPQIKIWPTEDFLQGEPDDDDPRWGWASLFLPGIGSEEAGKDDMQKEGDGLEAGPGTYADRYRMPVVRAGQFSLRLAEYDIVKESDDIRRVRYRVEDGKHVLLPVGSYSFRIRTKDTASDTGNRMIPTDEGPWITGFFPPAGFGTVEEDYLRPREEPVKILVFSSDTRPVIELNNEDIAAAVLNEKPNIYITEPTTKKIAVGRAGRNDFRLKIFSSHPDGIDKAVLMYTHESSGRTGFLKWDDTAGGLGYANPADEASRASGGYLGEYYDPEDPLAGKLFTFSADGGLKDVYNNVIFTTSSEPYTLSVIVYYSGGMAVDPPARYTLYMDGKGPDVSIRSIIGAAQEPSGGAVDFEPKIPGGLINDNGAPPNHPYKVNGNIQVVVDRTDELGVMAYGAGMGKAPPEAGYPMVKWIIEEDRTGYLNAAGTILQKLKAYSENPSHGALEFFHNIEETRASGWVRLPSADVNASDADRTHNFKFNTLEWNKKRLWLYVIAQDGVQNLGFIMQRIDVDDDSDKPELIMPTLFKDNAGGTPITGPLNLDVAVSIGADRVISRTGNWSAETPRRNVLEKDQGIEMNFLDDDGINLDAGGVVIKLTDLNITPNKTVTLTDAQVKEALKAGGKKDMSGTLSQAAMAAALYGPASDGNPTHLKDGTYRIEITVTDNAGDKVAITPPLYPGDSPSTAFESAVYYFAVYTEPPRIIVESPQDNSLQNNAPVDIKGRVLSRLKAQSLWITFSPDVMSASLEAKAYEIPLYADAAYTLPSAQAALDADGFYTYYWIQKDVIFNPDGLFGEPPENVFDRRNFSLEAYDRLGNSGGAQLTVQIDTTPPEVILIDYNHSRQGDLYGKVPFVVSASDTNGLLEINGEAGIRWWVLPAAPPDDPLWNTAPVVYNGWTGGGSFLLTQQKNGRYTGVIDTRKLTDGGEYRLCVMAVDKAQNMSAVVTKTFRVNQSGDLPVIDINSLNPAQNSVKGRAGLVISGTASDGSLFDPDKVDGYVKIRFPAAVNAEGTPTGWSDDDWITVRGSIDPAGAIKFEFRPEDDNDYLSADGTKHYQIRVSDEPDVGVNNKNYGKNPDIAADLGGYDYHGAVTKTFPGETTSYQFILDATRPVIFFDMYDPDPTHPNYTTTSSNDAPFRPTFSKVDGKGGLKEALSGTVIEAHLSTLSFSYSVRSETKSKLIIKIENPNLPYVQGTNHTWSIAGQSDADDLLSLFNDAPQGLQSIIMEATDVAGLVHRVSWTFYKDTQGPEILFRNIARAVNRDVSFTEPFPDWPSDWPYGTTWQTAWNDAWQTIIKDWPSEYAFLDAVKVIKALEDENANAPSVVSGGGDSPPVIQGSFYDALSFVRLVDPATGSHLTTYFEYRFKDSKGDPKSGWIPREIEKPAGSQKENSVDWKITLNSAGGFEGDDGENWFDIRVSDSAGNVSYIYNIRFLVDRAAPKLGDSDDPLVIPDEFVVASVTGITVWTAKPLPKIERVFSGDVNTGVPAAAAFTLRGRVSDHNLGSLQITIGQESSGASVYAVVALVEIDPLSVSPSVSPSTGTGVTAAPEDQFDYPNSGKFDTGTRRLALAGPYNPGTTIAYNDTALPPEWEWTLSVLQKDIAGLRDAAGAAADSARRYISVIATDKAKRKTGPAVWDFYLDTKKPVIEYTTLDKGRYGSAFDKTVTLSGIVSDDTKIRDAQYMIGKWVYAAPDLPVVEKWRWDDGGGTWALTEAPARETWPSAFADDARQTTMNWNITQATLERAAAGTFPPNLFSEEGQYRIDLYVTDWSLGKGNPHDTMNINDANFEDKGSYIASLGGGGNNLPGGYDVRTGTGNASGRVFFIDKNDPTLEWSDDTDGRTYFRNEKGQVIFGFIAGDFNTIQKWEAVIRDENGIILHNGTSVTPTVGNIPDPGIDPAETKEQALDLSPFMTLNGDKDSTPLDVAAGGAPKTYTITLTVTDGAKKETSITKQFILDNSKPEFDNLRPAGYQNGEPSTYEAVTGRMNIRGNAQDNSNMLKRVAFHVARGVKRDNSVNYPKPEDITDWHWHDPANPDNYQIKINGTAVMRIEEGTFAWELRAPQSSLFKTIDHVDNDYVQWTTIGGTYRDVNTSTWVTSSSPIAVPALTFADLMKADPMDKKIDAGEEVGLITVYVLVEDMAGNIEYKVLKYWLWPEGDRPQVISINNPDSTKIKAERILNGSIRISGMARDNEQVKYVWFRVLDTNGVPYTLEIPRWDEYWEPITGQYQSPKDGADIGKRRDDDLIGASAGGWYMANGGGSKSVSWWAYINTNGELEPETLDANEIIVEVRAQDISWDDASDDWMKYDPVTPGYFGFASRPRSVEAWVVAGAPVFDSVFVAKGPSDTAVWGSIDKTSINNRSSYRVTVKHNAGISAIRWSPTEWNAELNNGAGGFRADPNAEAYNLLNLADGQYVYRNSSGVYVPSTRDDAFDALTGDAALMAVTVQPKGKKAGSSVTLIPGKKYLIWKWAAALETSLVFAHDVTHNDPPTVAGVHRDMKNTVFSAPLSGVSYPVDIGSAVLIESETEDGVDYFKWDVIVDVRADLLLEKLLEDDPKYGNVKDYPERAGQTINSVRYPVYLSATDASRSTPLTTRGDTLLPIDNLAPYGMYTLNRRPAGIAATIGGEAGDDGPVSGVARVVLWFSRDSKANGGTRQFISWHEREETDGTTTLGAVSGFADSAPASGGEGWWDDNNVIAAWNAKYSGNPLKQVRKPYIPAESAATGGEYAIVIDRNNTASGTNHHGHKLAMGFSDGGMGKYWYVEINSLGIKSGPVTLHYVVIDKAGNAAYYYEPLVIMNNAPVIDKIKLGTDIRHNDAFRTADFTANARESTGAAAAGTSPLLDKIRARVPLGDTDVQRGISDYIYSNAMGAQKMIDFNARNNLFALRVETTKGSGPEKTRNFRLEYVSGARLLTNTTVTSPTLAVNIKAGRVYIIDDPGTAKWGAVGADGEGPWPRGYAFLAAVDGIDDEDGLRINGTGSAWELNSTYPATGQRTADTVPEALRLGDAGYAADETVGNAAAQSAEFVYNYNAFRAADATPRQGIVDYDGSDAYPRALGVNPAIGNSMFILRVFDGDEEDMFGDFTIIRIRVNNNDKTAPFAQVYDINPKTEGQERSNTASTAALEQTRLVTPMFVGEGAGGNRVKGGLWNTSMDVRDITKSGHVEPRRATSLTSAQMGGASSAATATITKPYLAEADKNTKLFAVDTVSGQVVLRGYVEDDQRVTRVNLLIGGTTITILEYDTGNGTGGNTGAYEPPRSGFLKIPNNANTNNRVYFADSVDLYRHRVEWAYIWDTETMPADTVVATGVNVRVVSYNRDALTANVKTANTLITAPGNAHTNTSPDNPGFPVGLRKYNSIDMNLRPYITGIMRNTNEAKDTRSRQGRYSLRRAERVLITGFNMDKPNTGNTQTFQSAMRVGSGTFLTTGMAGAWLADFGLTAANTAHHRTFNMSQSSTVPGSYGAVDFYVIRAGTNYYAANNSGRGWDSNLNRTAVLPWNIEYNPGIEGSELWDDVISAHIWQSDDNNGSSTNPGYFASTDNWKILSPSMSIDPKDGTLWESHIEEYSTANGEGSTRMTPITTRTVSGGSTTSNTDVVMQFGFKILFSDVYRSPGFIGQYNTLTADTFVAASFINSRKDFSDIPGGVQGYNYMHSYGGIFIRGPGGSARTVYRGSSTLNLGSTFNTNMYYGESVWYNADVRNNSMGLRYVRPEPTDQFWNPHVVTSYSMQGASVIENIHVSYYDKKDGSLKYRYNRRGTPGTLNPAETAVAHNNVPKMWTNLDGGADYEDTDPTTYTWGGSIAEAARVVKVIPNYPDPVGISAQRGSINAGRHNAIAVSSEGYPVIAYYDETNQRLKLAVGRNEAPVLGDDWIIRDYVIPRGNANSQGTGEYVSIKINTIHNGYSDNTMRNRVHIAAMNKNKRLVYISGMLNPNRSNNNRQDDTSDGEWNVLTEVKVRVVDSTGNVGRWCALSLDADADPWITYMDEDYLGRRGGVKVAVFKEWTYPKGVDFGANSYFPGEYTDMYGESLGGWEIMRVPTAYKVENPSMYGAEHGRLGLECFPTRNTTPNSNVDKFWSAAVGYLSQDGMDKYRVAYYVK